jgi:asparagine synthase (glutamine-hydrolysing)
MCAICGIVSFEHGGFVDQEAVHAMASAMQHRGPDDEGFLSDGPACLGFRRLSIIDLAGGHQPMFNEDNSAAIVFNGEVYNYRDLHSDLVRAGHVFRTKSDTETILHAYEEYGDACVQRLRGMFGFAIWDRSKRSLLLARDRLGIKPIYYYSNGRWLAFASEIKALLTIPEVPREIDPEALDQYLALRYVPGERTMLRNIFRLAPGHTLTVQDGAVRIAKYWDFPDAEETQIDSRSALEQFRALLEESVRLRMRSDVPLGVFLSGGLDSTAILATMSRISGGQRIKTFSVGYAGATAEERQSSELDYARLAANRFGAEHHEHVLNAREFGDSIPGLVWHLDEPLADASCIPLHSISKLARQHITVVLSGEGADEILAGYGIYSRMQFLARFQNTAPGKLLPWMAKHGPTERLRHWASLAGDGYRGVCRGFTAGARSELIGRERLEHSESQIAGIFAQCFDGPAHASLLNRLLQVDGKIWLPCDLLLKADKMTMASSLELRVPFLDHKLVEFASSLPDQLKLHRRQGKLLLRQAMQGVIPDEILHRPKKGFPVPLASWLRGPLRSFVRDNLLSNDSEASALMNRGTIARMISEHESGADRSQELWALLMLEVWSQRFLKQSPCGRHVAA